MHACDVFVRPHNVDKPNDLINEAIACQLHTNTIQKELKYGKSGNFRCKNNFGYLHKSEN